LLTNRVPASSIVIDIPLVVPRGLREPFAAFAEKHGLEAGEDRCGKRNGSNRVDCVPMRELLRNVGSFGRA
jgi:hypothetical protein